MDLIVWRHAEAEDEAKSKDDLDRTLTRRGEKQATRVALWLDRQLPDGLEILSSPALRCQQTAMALGRKFKTREELLPDSTPEQLLAAVKWPSASKPVMVVGHQPMLGDTVARLLDLAQGSCQIRKGSVWWLRTRERDGQQQCVVVAVQTPDTV